MKKLISIVYIFVFGLTLMYSSDYKDTLNTWKSHDDVANWMKNNWEFNYKVAKQVVSKIRKEGPRAVVLKTEEETYENPNGWCKDAAAFTKGALNKINPDYQAEYIFISNKVKGAPDHWSTEFTYNGKIYVIDYGAGKKWKNLMGIHGPYDSIDEYAQFLSTAKAKNFEFDFIHSLKSENKSTEVIITQRAKMIISKFDKNSDKAISIDEAPRRMKENFENLDDDGDGLLSVVELSVLPPR